MTTSLLTNYLILGALLFAIGMIGFMSRRNLIVMFLSAELILQGVAINLVAFNRYHLDHPGISGANWDGQVFTLFVIAVAAAEAAIALALVVVLFRQRGSLDVSLWQDLREPGLPPVIEPESAEPPEQPIQWPQLPPAGLEPRQPEESPLVHVESSPSEHPLRPPTTLEKPE